MNTANSLGQVVTRGRITTMKTELGEERLCKRCGEFWPNDSEFFPMRDGRTRPPCRACCCELPSAVRKRKSYANEQQPERQL